MTNARYAAASAGILTAGLTAAGNNPTISATEEFDGTNWTAGGSLSIARRNTIGSGVQTDALVFGGYDGTPPVDFTAQTEGYNGTAWSTRPNLGTARYALASSQNAASPSTLAFGGMTPGVTASTEEFTPETTTANVKTFTTS